MYEDCKRPYEKRETFPFRILVDKCCLERTCFDRPAAARGVPPSGCAGVLSGTQRPSKDRTSSSGRSGHECSGIVAMLSAPMQWRSRAPGGRRQVRGTVTVHSDTGVPRKLIYKILGGLACNEKFEHLCCPISQADVQTETSELNKGSQRKGQECH